MNPDTPPRPPARRVTQKDVAAAAEVSLMTVSYALRDSAQVSAATRAMVKAVAERLGYQADPVLSALAAYRTQLRTPKDLNVVALAHAWDSPDAWLAYPSAQRYLEGARRRGQQLGYQVEPFWLRAKGMSAQRATEILYHRGIRAVIAGPNPVPDRTPSLDWKRFAVVVLEAHPDLSGFHTVGPYDFMAITTAWRELAALGRRRIGLVLRSQTAERVQRQWDAAFLVKQQRFTSEADRVPPLIVQDLDFTRADPVVAAWLREHRPDAILSKGDYMVDQLRFNGLRVPQDVAFACLNVVDSSAGCAGIDQRHDVMGATAVDILNSLLQRGHTGPDEAEFATLVQGVWRAGATAA